MTRGGFTLVEMTAAVFLATIIFLGLAAIFGTTFQFQKEAAYKVTAQDSALVSAQAIVRDLERTTYLGSPCPGGAGCNGAADTGSDTLTGCTNFDSTQGLVDPTASMRVYSYCVDNNGDMYDTWLDGSAGTALACPPAPAGGCGPNYLIPGGQNMRVAQGVTRDTTYTCGSSACGNPNSASCFFCRPANLANVIGQHYVIHVPPASDITVNTESTIAKPLNSPIP